MNDPGNPLQGLLGDLLKLIGGTQRGGAPWLDAARALAHGVATDGAPEPNADPIQRMKLEELARVAELHVVDTTGLPVGSGERPAHFVAVSRGAWALKTIDAWAPLLEKMVVAQESASHLQSGSGDSGREEAEGRVGTLEGLGGLGTLRGLEGLDDVGTSGSTGSGSTGSGSTAGLEGLLGRFAATMGPVLFGMQFGSAAGHLAQRALGQYTLPIPRPDPGELLVIPENISRFAEDWSLPIDQAQLWICTHELTSHAVLSLPHVADRIHALLEDIATDSASMQQGLMERLAGGSGDPEILHSLLSDPESLLTDLVTPGQRRASAELIAVTTALGGYVDHVTAGVVGSLTGSPAALVEAWYRYRTADAAGEQAAAALFGLDLGREQVDRGAAFIRGVVERSGEEGLARLWSSPRNLPTPAEVDAPGLWLERIDLPDAGEAHDPDHRA